MKNKTKIPNFFLGIILAVMYLPILVIVVYSFQASKISTVWEGFSLRWYRELFLDRSMREAVFNSLILAGISCINAAVIGTMAAVGMTRISWRSKGLIAYFSTLPIMIPEIILGMVFMVFFSFLGLPFGMTTLVLAHTAFCIPYVFTMVRSRLIGLDPSLTEAARDLGAGEVMVFFTVTLPLIAPAVASGMLLSFAMSFDDVVISIFVTGAATNTLPVKIYTQMKNGVSPEVNALSTIMLGGTVLVLLGSELIRRRDKK